MVWRSHPGCSPPGLSSHVSAQDWAQDNGHQPPNPSSFSSRFSLLLLLQEQITSAGDTAWTWPFWPHLREHGAADTPLLRKTLSAVTCSTALQQQRNGREVNRCNVVPTQPSPLDLADVAFPKTQSSSILTDAHILFSLFPAGEAAGLGLLLALYARVLDTGIFPPNKGDHNAQAQRGPSHPTSRCCSLQTVMGRVNFSRDPRTWSSGFIQLCTLALTRTRHVRSQGMKQPSSVSSSVLKPAGAKK